MQVNDMLGIMLPKVKLKIVVSWLIGSRVTVNDAAKDKYTMEKGIMLRHPNHPLAQPQLHLDSKYSETEDGSPK
jgi:hypothetical protein